MTGAALPAAVGAAWHCPDAGQTRPCSSHSRHQHQTCQAPHPGTREVVSVVAPRQGRALGSLTGDSRTQGTPTTTWPLPSAQPQALGSGYLAEQTAQPQGQEASSQEEGELTSPLISSKSRHFPPALPVAGALGTPDPEPRHHPCHTTMPHSTAEHLRPSPRCPGCHPSSSWAPVSLLPAGLSFHCCLGTS